MATHNPEIIPLADKVYRIKNGQLLPAPNPGGGLGTRPSTARIDF